MTQPIGFSLDETGAERPQHTAYAGRFVTLRPLNPDHDSEALYRCSHGSPMHDQIWTYMGYGPFGSADLMHTWLQTEAAKSDPMFLTVWHNETNRPVGLVSYLNINLPCRTIELGHIWYGLEAQRTKINTETIYLMLTEVLDRLTYRRVEWKCDALNARSRAAALRLGFQYEGTFRQHRIYKGRNRDTAWFSLLDSDWAICKAHMAQWLYGNNPNLSLTQLNRISHQI